MDTYPCYAFLSGALSALSNMHSKAYLSTQSDQHLPCLAQQSIASEESS